MVSNAKAKKTVSRRKGSDRLEVKVV